MEQKVRNNRGLAVSPVLVVFGPAFDRTEGTLFEKVVVSVGAVGTLVLLENVLADVAEADSPSRERLAAELLAQIAVVDDRLCLDQRVHLVAQKDLILAFLVDYPVVARRYLPIGDQRVDLASQRQIACIVKAPHAA